MPRPWDDRFLNKNNPWRRPMFVVAGVTGHVGSVVARTLLAKGEKVRVIVRDSRKGEAWSPQGGEVSIGSLDDPQFLKGAFRGASGAFVLVPSNLMAKDFYAYQCGIADAIASAVKAASVPHVAMLSSIGADLDRGNGPIRGLHYLEERLREAGTVLTAIRASYFQENVANSLGAARQAGIFPNLMPSADYAFPMIATKDIGTLAAERLMARPKKSEVIDLHGPPYSIRQVAEKLGDAIGRKLRILDVPEAGWVEAMTQGGLSQHMAEVYAEMYRGFASGAIQPKGDRLVQGETRIDEVIRGLV